MSDTETSRTPVLHICITCRAPGDTDTSAPAMGETLHDAIAARLSATTPLQVNKVVCLANCQRACAAAVTQDGKWSYLLGGLTPDQAQDLVDYALNYGQSASGVVLPSKRAESLRHAICGRLPGHAMPAQKIPPRTAFA